MADAVVEFLLENLKQLLLYNSDLIYGVKGQVDSLHRELSLMNAFLKDAKEKRNEYEYVRELVRQIRDVAYEAEDIIDTFVVNAAMQKERSTFSRIVHVFDYPTKLRSVAKDIESIKTKVKEIYDNKMFGIEALYAPAAGGESSNNRAQRRKPMVEEDNVVGFDEEAKEIVSRLTNISESLEVVSVVGMGGLGKTTLAKKVFCHPAIEFHFFVRCWVYVSQEYNRKEVLVAILSSVLLQPCEHIYKPMNEEMLVEEIYKHLDGRRYLVVLDDVWTPDAWNDLKMAFPNQNCGSRILLTSRNTDVGLVANPDSLLPPHHLKFLNDDESWELLSTKVFRRGRSCPFELVELGKTIARKCYGLPLAIVVVAGLLLKKDKSRDLWKKVAESVSSYVARDPKQCMDVLALSYKHLPDHLKVCFIYFGAFPEDFPIPVWKLLSLWVAEGFIQQKGGQDCLEDLAEEYLEDLVERNLVLVAKKRSNGRIKTCRVHDMLRDLCLREAAAEKFLQIVDSNPLLLVPYHRRLCVHSHVMNFIHSRPCGPHVRSFLCFPSEEKELSREHTSFIHESFKLVRVLDMRSINISRFPVEITQLVHLRYIALFGNFKVVPPSISKLWSLQTLIVETTSRDLDIQVDIWKMSQFRHLRTSGSSRLHGPKAKTRMDNEDPFVQRNIQTISTISPDSCTENILARTPNLKKLGIRGRLSILMDDERRPSLFDNFAKLDNLGTLKLLNDTFPRPPPEGKLRGLPSLYKFPPHLNKLTLSDTLLDWKHMSTIGMLPHLQVLKLKMYAFKGAEWEALDGGFRLLKVLEIGKTDLVVWKASAHHFPRLEHVVVDQCSDLSGIPVGLADVSALNTMELYHTPSALDSARFIQQQKQMQMQQHKLMKTHDAFKLLIYPPE